MSTEGGRSVPSQQSGDDSAEAESTPTWVKVIDRMLWGVNAPVSRADRSRKFKEMGGDLLGAAKWIGSRFFS